MNKFIILMISTSLMFISGFTTLSNAQENIYETYTKKIIEQKNVSSELKEDAEGLNQIKYLKLKTDSQYEIALANPDGTYSYVDSSDNLQFAINKADDEASKQKSDTIPVVINKDGLVVYATQGIGRVVKIVDGVPSTAINTTTNIYKTADLKSPEHTYINHAYIDDVPIIEDNGDVMKIEVSGYGGYIEKFDEDGNLNIITVPMNQVKGLSYYSVNTQGDLVHSISSDITDGTKYSHQKIGPSPSYIKPSIKYYSYDGNYFYDNINELMEDAAANNHNNAINLNNPYYNYYQYLPGRSKTSYTAQEINAYFEKHTPSDSVLRNTGQYFIKAQNEYGTNAAMLVGIAMNESNRGISEIAKTKFNIFGSNAKDAFPQGADSFNSVEECIMRVANHSFSNGYFNPKSWKYNSSTLGNKSFGANVRYASDPYWSEKAMARMYELDKTISNGTGLKDYNRYVLGMYTNETTVKNSSGKDLYNILPHDERQNLYGSNPALGQVGDTTIILDNDSSTYEIRPDRVVGINETNMNKDGTYLWDKMGIVDKNDIKIINEVAQINTDFSNHWAKTFITDGMNKGWVDTTNIFNPENSITRAEFVKIVNRAFNLTEKGEESFNDVNEGDWFYDEVKIAVKAGYINGRSATQFAPYEPITRQEAAKVVGIILGLTNDTDIKTTFNDDLEIANWADGYVDGLSKKGILNGYKEDNTFRPNDNIKRGESIKILSLAKYS